MSIKSFLLKSIEVVNHVSISELERKCWIFLLLETY